MDMLRKDQLEHGAYYRGMCRNAEVARWNSKVGNGIFIHWRTKFWETYPETIAYWEENHQFDEFRPFEKIEKPEKEIPLTQEEFDAAGGFAWNTWDWQPVQHKQGPNP